jgi:hypothetical protein
MKNGKKTLQVKNAEDRHEVDGPRVDYLWMKH